MSAVPFFSFSGKFFDGTCVFDGFCYTNKKGYVEFKGIREEKLWD